MSQHVLYIVRREGLRLVGAALAEFYSKNLSSEYQKGRRERVLKGFWSGDPPFGYRVVRKLDEAGNFGAVNLEPDPHDAEGVRIAFREYPTGLYSDAEIALMLPRLEADHGLWNVMPSEIDRLG